MSLPTTHTSKGQRLNLYYIKTPDICECAHKDSWKSSNTIAGNVSVPHLYNTPWPQFEQPIALNCSSSIFQYSSSKIKAPRTKGFVCGACTSAPHPQHPLPGWRQEIGDSSVFLSPRRGSGAGSACSGRLLSFSRRILNKWNDLVHTGRHRRRLASCQSGPNVHGPPERSALCSSRLRGFRNAATLSKTREDVDSARVFYSFFQEPGSRKTERMEPGDTVILCSQKTWLQGFWNSPV